MSAEYKYRLKNYSAKPSPSDWERMEQLLNADTDSRPKPVFVWWKYGLIIIGLLFSVAAALAWYNMDTIKTTPVSLENMEVQMAESSDTKSKVSPNTNSSNNTNNEITSIETNDDLKIVADNNTQANNEFAIIENSTSQSNTDAEKPIPANNNQGSLPPTNQVVTSAIVFNDEPNAFAQAIIDTDKNKVEIENNLLASVDTPEKLSSLSNVPSQWMDLQWDSEKLQPEFSMAEVSHVEIVEKVNPWYVGAGAGIKYPTVDLSQSNVGDLVPTRKFIPSYSIDASIGRNVGKSFAIEAGVETSLFQYKLGKVIDADEYNDLQAENDIFINADDLDLFIVSRSLVLNPYIKGIYKVPMKSGFEFQSYFATGLNNTIDLPDYNDSASLEPMNPNATFVNEASIFEKASVSRNNFNFDLGVSLFKRIGKKNRLGLDFSYSFGIGNLVNGEYTLLGNTNRQSTGGYSISGGGPKLKMKYYFGFNS